METSVSKSHIGVVTHLFMLVLVHTRPCYEGNFESCFPSKALKYDVANSDKQFSQEHSEEARQKYNLTVRAREMRGILEEYLKNCTGCEESDEVDREDHFTQYLSELLVNTDSEITSLQGSDVEEIKEDSGSSSKEDGDFASLTVVKKR